LLCKNFVSSVEAEMGTEGQIMCISSVSRFSKSTRIVCDWSFAPDPTEERRGR